MKYPLSTGEVARLLGATEPQLSEVVRRGHIDPPPRVVAGRRLWNAEHLQQAAKVLGVFEEFLQDELGRLIGQADPPCPGSNRTRARGGRADQ